MNTMSKTGTPVKTRFRSRFLSLWNQFRRDESGISAVEFALVSPFLLGTWIGLAAILDTENATTKVGKVTATVADMIAQAPVANSDFINASFNAGKAMLGNVENDNLKIYVAGLRINTDLEIEVVWICGRNFSGDAMSSAVENIDLPSQLKQAPGFIVASYGEYTHSPIYGNKIGGDNTYKYNNYFVPRHSLETLNDGCDG